MCWLLYQFNAMMNMLISISRYCCSKFVGYKVMVTVVNVCNVMAMLCYLDEILW